MSAYGHEMEREYSAQSILAGEGSEMGSRYTNEEGIYMSSFAATVFISGLVTVGISVLSLLVALTVMLNSCESRNSGVLEMYKNTQSYDYCRNFALHADLNSLGEDLFPAICKDINIRYVKEGQYRKDLNITIAITEEFFSSFRPQDDGRDVVLMDADDFLMTETLYANQMNKDALHDSSRDANYLRHIFALKLYLKLQSGGWPLILLSRKPEKLRNTTVEYLISVGCHGWSSLIMRVLVTNGRFTQMCLPATMKVIFYNRGGCTSSCGCSRPCDAIILMICCLTSLFWLTHYKFLYLALNSVVHLSFFAAVEWIMKCKWIMKNFYQAKELCCKERAFESKLLLAARWML